ncbi:NusG domain II-containing protein [Desulfosporosinus hippei]|uniref:NusG domain II-containing protein n=1 Tax=Desulfosporosinus hippei TaxID=569859 RepID=UPI001A9A52F0|nr:NusG domain II-containing protein [Desulfosporosinus hippei]
MQNETMIIQKITRRKFLLGGFSAGALSASAFLLGQKVTIADSLKSPTEPQWQITVDGKLVQAGTFVADLRKDLLIPVQNGTAHVILEGNRIFVHNDNTVCEKKICSMMGAITKSGECITCLPNKLVIRVL